MNQPWVGDHPEPEKLSLFLLGKLTELDSIPIEDHLQHCTTCLEQIEDVPITDSLVGMLQGAEKQIKDSEAKTYHCQVLSPRQTGLSEPGSYLAVGFPGYEVRGELGRGGMGIVYKALQIDLQRYVAIKVLFHSTRRDADALLRFRQEAEALARINHPNIVQVYEVQLDHHPQFLALEYVEGSSLDDRLEDCALEPRAAAQLVARLARGMQAAHNAGVIHRDLKPSNILWSSGSDLPKITDFGIARRIEGAVLLTQPGCVMGTPAYMAPEQAMAQNDLVGPSTDIYALGAILYECLTGRPPFQAPTPTETMTRVAYHEPVPPGQLCSELPRDLESICLKCLEKEQSRRYATADDLHADLDRFLNGIPTHARPATRLEKAWRWCRRNPLPAALLMVVVFLLVGGTTLSTLLAIHAGRQEKEAREAQGIANQNALSEKAAREKAEQAQAREARERKRAETAIVQTQWLLYASRLRVAQKEWDQGDVDRAREVLCSAQWDLRHWEHHHLYHLFHRGQVVIRSHSRGVQAGAFSPNGNQIASADYSRLVQVHDARTGKVLWETQGENPTGSRKVQLTYSPDGKHLLIGNDSPAIEVLDSETGQQLFHLQSPKTKHSANRDIHAAFSPNGKQLLTGDDNSAVVLWALQTGKKIRDIFPSQDRTDPVVALGFSPNGKYAVFATLSQGARVWDFSTGELLCAVETDATKKPIPRLPILASFGRGLLGMHSAAFSPNGNHILTASTKIQIHDIQTGKCLRILPNNSLLTRDVSFTPDGRMVFAVVSLPGAGGLDTAVIAWEVTGARRYLLNGVKAYAFSPDSRQIVTVGPDKHMVLRDIQTGNPIADLKGHSSNISRMAFSPCGKRLCSTGYDKRVILWNLDEFRKPFLLKGKTDSLRFSPNGNQLLAAGLSGRATIWNYSIETEDRSIQGRQSGLYSAQIDPTGRYAATASQKGHVHLFDMKGGKFKWRLKAHPRAIQALAFSPNGSHLATGGQDRCLKVWNVKTKAQELILKGHARSSTCAAYSPDGSSIVTGSDDQTARIWDSRTGKLCHVLKGHLASVTSITFNPNGNRIATGDRNGKIKIQNVKTGESALVLQGHSQMIYSIAWSSDGKRIVSASADDTVKIWDAECGHELLTLRHHAADVRRIAFSPDGRLLVTGDSRGHVVVLPSTKEPELVLAAGPDPIAKAVLSTNGKQIATTDIEGRVSTFDAISGNRVESPRSSSVLRPVPAMLPSKYQLQIHGTKAIKVPVGYSPEEDRLQRIQQSLPTAQWHQRQARRAEKEKRWFTAAFHWQQVFKHQPWRVSVFKRWYQAKVNHNTPPKRKRPLGAKRRPG